MESNLSTDKLPPEGDHVPALPWVERHAIDPDHDYIAMASKLPLKRHRTIPRFLRDTLRIRRQLAETPGLVGYGLNAQLLRKTFWTFSVWQDQASLDAFAASDPHRHITGRLAPHMHPSRFAFFAIPGGDVPLTWHEVTVRLDPATPSSGVPIHDEGR